MSIGAYEPFWIEHGRGRLHAALHRSATDAGARVGALFIAPLLHEQQRSHRLFCEMASELSALGICCLRFSFFGTGDSDGIGEQQDFESMRADIDLAAQALRERCDCDSMIAIALRSGALPLRAWLDAGGVADAVVLWDPVLDGEIWLQQLERADARERRALSDAAPENDGQLMGYGVSWKFRRELAQARWRAAAGANDPALWAVVHAEAVADTPRSAHTLALPVDAPKFGTTVEMDSALMLSPRMEMVVRQLGTAVLAGG